MRERLTEEHEWVGGGRTIDQDRLNPTALNSL
jgi:hypothetical protein